MRRRPIPNYNVLDKTTGVVTIKEMKISEMVEMLESNPNLDVVPAAVPYGDPFQLGVTRPDSKFVERMKDIKRRNPKNTISGTHF